MSTKNTDSVLTDAQYELLVSPEPTVPTHREIFGRMIRFWVGHGLGKFEDFHGVEVLMEELEASHLEEPFPFLVVPPWPEHFDFRQAMNLVCLGERGERKGMNALYSASILPAPEEVLTPGHPYLVLGIEDGRQFLGQTVQEAGLQISEAGRSCLWLWEAIAFCACFPGSLVHHDMAMASTGWRSPREVVGLRVDDDGDPLLTYYWVGEVQRRLGCPSCSNRLGLE